MNYTANIARENELNKIKKVDQANCAELNKIIENITKLIEYTSKNKIAPMAIKYTLKGTDNISVNRDINSTVHKEFAWRSFNTIKKERKIIRRHFVKLGYRVKIHTIYPFSSSDDDSVIHVSWKSHWNPLNRLWNIIRCI